MSTSRLDLFFAIVSSQAGVRRQFPESSLAEPFLSIEGDTDPSTPATDTYTCPASADTQIYDFDTDGAFECAALTTDEEIELWAQMGSPADGSSTKTTLLWQCLGKVRAGGFHVWTSDLGVTNADASAQCANSLDTPSGASDAGKTAARIYVLSVRPTGSSAATVQFARRN